MKVHVRLFVVIYWILFRFSAMLSENPDSWQSQSMAIIQFILAHKYKYS